MVEGVHINNSLSRSTNSVGQREREQETERGGGGVCVCARACGRKIFKSVTIKKLTPNLGKQQALPASRSKLQPLSLVCQSWVYPVEIWRYSRLQKFAEKIVLLEQSSWFVVLSHELVRGKNCPGDSSLP